MEKLQGGALKADNTPYTDAEIKSHNDFIDLVTGINKDAMANLISKEVAETMVKDAIEAATTQFKNENKELTEKLRTLGTFVSQMKNTSEKVEPKTRHETLKEALVTNKADILEIGKGVSSKEITLKANTVRASIATNIESMPLTDIGQLGVKERSLYDVATKLQVSESNNSGQISYIDWDESTTVRAAAMRAEGVAFPESTAKFKNYQISLKKIGDTLPVSEEFYEDEAIAASELDMFLEVNVNSVVDNQLVNGDGTGNNMTGLLASTPEWSPSAYGIPDANIYDTIQKMTTGITTNRGSKYKREYIKAVLNSDTYDKLVLKKDANNNYQFPPNHPIYSRVVVDNNLADNKMVVGDMRYLRIYEKGGLLLSKGEVNAQFTEDMMTLKVRARKLFLIRTVDQTGFLKCSDVDAAIATISASVLP
jgi:hypothetical protein